MKIVYTTVFLATLIILTGTTYAERKLVKVDGSSTVFPITEAVSEEFQIEKKGSVMVTVGISGTGGGFKKFCRNEIDITNASRPIKETEISLCKKNGIEYMELPVAYDGIAIMVNPKNNWVDYLTVAELKKLWEPSAQGKIKKWSQIRKNWPDKELRLYGAGADSGTFDYFTEAITGKSGLSRGDYTASEDDNVLVQGVSMDPNGLGYFGIAYYEHNKDRLKLVPIDDNVAQNGKGAIIPTVETIKNGAYQPLSRPIFIYVNKKSVEKPEVDEYVKFYLKNAGALSKEVGYIPLPDKAYGLVSEKFRKRTIGSVFMGAKTGVEIEDLLK